MAGIMDKYWQGIGFTLIGLIALVGCSNDESQNQSFSAGQGDVMQQVSKPSPGNENLSVTLVPSVVSTNTELRAIAGGNPSTFAFEWQVNGVLVQGNSSNRLAAESFSKGDRVAVTMRTDTAEVTATTEIVNSPPRVLSASFIEPRLHAGVDIGLKTETADADEDAVAIRYIWTLNGEIVSAQAENYLPGKLLKRGDRVTFTAIPTDGEIDGPHYVANEFVIPNGAPRFVSTYPLQFSNFIYSYSARAEDPDGDPLLYLLESGPAGMTIDPQSGELYWEIKTGQGGEHRVSIIAQDTEGLRATQDFALIVRIPE